MTRLSLASAEALGEVTRHKQANRIVHIGFGQFARAHLASYTQQTLEPWHITAVNLNSDRVKKQLSAQDFLYSLTVKDKHSESSEIMSVVDEALCPRAGDAGKFRERLLSPQTKIVSLTVTEKGYYQNSEGELDFAHKDIEHDLQPSNEFLTAIGWLVWAIRERKNNGVEPFTPVSLDNLNGNGQVLKAAVIAFASRLDGELADYIDTQIPFPCSMVDRIVPAVTDAQIEAVQNAIGVRDEACVVTEVFSQWALEDNFAGPRPNWERAGVQLCEKVEPFEHMKLRLLNGAHSAIAYVGLLCGFETVADCIDDPAMGAFIGRLMREEIKPQVQAPEGVVLEQYIDLLLTRFSNPHLHHRVAQIAMDGSQKIPQRWVPVVLERTEKNEKATLLAFCVAAWIECITRSETWLDPKSDQLRELASGSQEARASSVMFLSGVFPEALRNSDFVELVQSHLIRLNRDPKAALNDLLG